MKLNCVILNYNDADTVEKLVSLIHDYKILEHIVIVDNASAEDSAQKLERLCDKKVALVHAEKNGGRKADGPG